MRGLQSDMAGRVFSELDQISRANGEAADPFTSGCENGIADRGGHGRDSRLAATAGRF